MLDSVTRKYPHGRLVVMRGSHEGLARDASVGRADLARRAVVLAGSSLALLATGTGRFARRGRAIARNRLVCFGALSLLAHISIHSALALSFTELSAFALVRLRALVALSLDATVIARFGGYVACAEWLVVLVQRAGMVEDLPDAEIWIAGKVIGVGTLESGTPAVGVGPVETRRFVIVRARRSLLALGGADAVPLASARGGTRQRVAWLLLALSVAAVAGIRAPRRNARRPLRGVRERPSRAILWSDVGRYSNSLGWRSWITR